MPEDIHPGSWVGDTTAEFKKLPTWGKFAAVGALVAVAGIGWYEYNKGKGTNGATVSGASDPTAAGVQSPFSMVPGQNGSSTPVVPQGTNPLFDSQGQLIGWIRS